MKLYLKVNHVEVFFLMNTNQYIYVFFHQKNIHDNISICTSQADISLLNWVTAVIAASTNNPFLFVQSWKVSELCFTLKLWSSTLFLPPTTRSHSYISPKLSKQIENPDLLTQMWGSCLSLDVREKQIYWGQGGTPPPMNVLLLCTTTNADNYLTQRSLWWLEAEGETHITSVLT